MLYEFISRIFRPRHYWRTVSFDAISELYASQLMTVFALNIINLFAAVYLFQLGYSIVFISLVYAGSHLLGMLVALLAAKYAAYFGARQGTLAANIMRIPALVAFAMVPEWGVSAVIAFALLQSTASTFHNVCFWIEFSKYRHVEKAGREVSVMQIIEKIAKIASPIIGGAIAAIWGPNITVIVASFVFMIAAIPLFQTTEPEPLKSRLKFEGFPWRLASRSVTVNGIMGADNVASILTWSLFIAAFVFNNTGNELYMVLGAVASIGVLASIAGTWFFGKIVDNNHDKELFVSGAIGNSLTHLFRPFAGSAAYVVGTNIVNETITTAYLTPHLRIVLDVADTSGHRTAYAMMLEVSRNIGSALFCLLMAGLVYLLGDMLGLQVAFACMAIIGALLIFLKPLRQA